MSSDNENNKKLEELRRWLRAEAARIMAGTDNEEIKQFIAKSLETLCEEILTSPGDIDSITKKIRTIPKYWNSHLELANWWASTPDVQSPPIDKRPVRYQWLILCAWLAIKAHSLIRETYQPELKRRIADELNRLIDDSHEPHSLPELEARTTAFEDAVRGWQEARMKSIEPNLRRREEMLPRPNAGHI